MTTRNDRADRKAAAGPKAPAGTPTDWPRHRYIALGLCALVLVAYFNCFRSGFVFDNRTIILEDPRIQTATSQNIAAIWSKGYWYLAQDPTLFRPLTTFSYLFNYAILGNGTNPEGYHSINLILHAANVLLLYALSFMLFRKTAPAAALAALWAVHPVLTESITNIVGRADLLSCFGILAGMMCHVQAQSATGGRKWAWLAGLAAALAVGVFSKESGVVLILLMLVYDVTFRRAEIRASLSGYLAAAIPLTAFFYMRSQVLAGLPVANTVFVNNPLLGLGFTASRLTAIQVIGRYLWLLVWPVSLSSDYSYNQIPLFRGTFHNWGDWASLLALAVCLAAAVLAVLWFQRNKPGFFFLALFFVALAPVANIAILIGTIMAERLLYVPSIGFLGCLVVAAFAAVDKFAPGSLRAATRLCWGIGVVCLAFCLRTQFRNADWESERTLWTAGVNAAPDSYKTHQNLAVEFFRDRAGIDRAIAEGERSLAILKGLAPGQEDVLTYVDIGAHHRAKGDIVRNSGTPDAEAQSRLWYQKALAILQHGEEVDRAVTESAIRVNRAAGKDPGRLGQHLLYQELGQAYLRLGRPAEAIRALEAGLMIRLTPELFQLLSEAYTDNRDQNGSAIALLEAIVLYPEQKAFPSELLKLYQDWTIPTCAVEKTGGGANLNLGCPLVHNHLCAAAARVRELHTRRGEAAEAEKLRVAMAQSLGCPAQ